ncbi:hypothetical protein VPH35_083999 [Triticum aestivum]
MRSQVDLMIEGVPSHVWTRDTAAELLGSGCLVESLAPETANREDLSLFKLRAWCVDPDEVPVAWRLWVPESEMEYTPAARRPTSRQLLEYKTLIHIGRVREYAGPEGWLRPPSLDGSGQSGLPDDSGSYSGSGDWRVLPWTRGVRDARGGAPDRDVAGRSYRQALLGRVGPSDWRLPPMGAVCPRVTMASRLVFPSPVAADPPVQTPVRIRVAAEEQVPARHGGSPAAADHMRSAAEIPEVVAVGQALVSRGIAEDHILIPGVETGPANAEAPAPAAAVDPLSGDAELVGVQNEVGTGQVAGPVGEPHETTPGWAPVYELLPPTTLHAEERMMGPTNGANGQVEIGDRGARDCMIEPADVGTTACMDVDVHMHVPNGARDVPLPPKEQIAVANIKAFCAGLMKKLAPPLLKEIEAVCGKGLEYTPRQTTRSATVNMPRKSKATAAETVLLKALGITPEGLAVTDETLTQLKQMFDSPIKELQLRALAAIFGKVIPFDLGQEVAPKVALLA